jgi:hypothetical protein
MQIRTAAGAAQVRRDRGRSADTRPVSAVPRPRGERILRRAIVIALMILGAALVTTLVFFALLQHGALGASPVGDDVAGARSDRPGMRVLFVGNSLTFVNDMPKLLMRLVASDPANRPLFAARYAPGGSRLELDVGKQALDDLLEQVRWDDVVLQENSSIPSYDLATRERYMYPAARTLVAQIRARAMQPLFFLTWGYRDGNTAGGYPDSYRAMQDRLTTGYDDIAGQLAVPIAPVGTAWAAALAERPSLDLWQPDGLHPSLGGSYLTACVFYALLYHRDPASSYTAGLPRSEAAFLQRIARTIVSA